jgi:hypothetical protein
LYVVLLHPPFVPLTVTLDPFGIQQIREAFALGATRRASGEPLVFTLYSFDGAGVGSGTG